MSAKVYYCPSYEVTESDGGAYKHRYGYVDSNGNSGGFPKPGEIGPAKNYFVNMYYQASFDAGGGLYRAARLSSEGPNTAVTADFWLDGFGRYTHWSEGYNTSYLDGHVEWRADTGHAVAEAAVATINSWPDQISWWGFFFDQ